jgi:hypothetical protein
MGVKQEFSNQLGMLPKDIGQVDLCRAFGAVPGADAEALEPWVLFHELINEQGITVTLSTAKEKVNWWVVW